MANSLQCKQEIVNQMKLLDKDSFLIDGVVLSLQDYQNALNIKNWKRNEKYSLDISTIVRTFCFNVSSYAILFATVREINGSIVKTNIEGSHE